jgi:hypothetical protein
MVQSPKEDKLAIQLGDIIQINAPTNKELDQKQFYINYLDPNKLILLEHETNKTLELRINNGNLRDESITDIILLDRAPEPGYAKQNNLLPETWIDIHFGGDVPTIITGKITNLEEDMIEIKLWPSNDIIYIDFAYQGIPEDLPIIKIDANRPPPKDSVPDTVPDEVDPVPDGSDTVVHETKECEDSADSESSPESLYLKEILLDADQLQFGEMLGERHQLIEVPEAERRFSIEHQTEDMLNNMLANIPNFKRTPEKLARIQLLIKRFKQLRELFSEFDQYGAAESSIKKGAEHKPLVKSLLQFNQKLYWILPIVQNIKKIYDTEFDDAAIDIEKETLANYRINETNIYNIYLNNDITEGQNKYDALLKSLNPYLTPFAPPVPSKQIISQIPVKTNIAAIVDNHEDMYSSVWSDKSITSFRFLIQNYNVGLTRITQDDRGIQSKNIRHSIAKNDTLFIKSLLTLPEITTQFSKINLPGTNIMTRSALQQHFLYYWQLLKKNTNYTNVLIDNLDDNTELDKNLNLDTIRTYVLDERLEDEDKYDKFLNLVVPKTILLFKLIQKYIIGGFSLNQIISYLEPFMIYHSDLTYNQYVLIIDFIDTKINDYKKNYIEKSRNYQILNQFKQNIPPHILLELLKSHGALKDQIEQAYDLYPSMSDAEMLYKIINIDSGKLFTTSLVFLNEGLMVSGKFEEILQLNETLTKINNEKPNEQKNDECEQYVLSKKYLAIDELEDDNDKLTYFDKNYDKTFYDIVLEYSQQQQSMDPDEFKLFLINELKEKNGLSQEVADRDTEAMIEGKRRIQDGDYAVLQTDDEELEGTKMYYYIRSNNRWERAENISEDVFADKNKIFCNFQDNCFSINNKCTSLESSKFNDNMLTVKTMLNEFDEEFTESQKEINKKIESIFAYHLHNIQRIKTAKETRQYKYNNIAFEFGLEAEEEKITQSPHFTLRDIILQQPDFVKKQSDTLRFCDKFTRAATKEENVFWLYCNDTNVKLLPTFIQRLALSFSLNNNYIDELNRICKEQGKLSDDGDSWVDEHSGYTIRRIEFDTEEGYTEGGFKETTRAILEQDIGNVLLQKEIIKFEDPSTQIISNIVSSLSQYMGINIDPQREFIINGALSTLKEALPTKQDYATQEKRAADKGKKKIMSYSHLYNSSLIYITAAFFLVGIQINIPSIQTRKTFPNCIRSFEGFPLQGNEDKSGLTYVGCVLHKIKSSVEPWDAIKKTGQKGIIKRIDGIITTFIINNSVIQEKLSAKLLYLATNKTIEIPNEHNIATWFNFLPPLRALHLKHIHNIGEEFNKTLLDDLKKGKKVQNEKIGVIKGKILHFSLSIQMMIENVVHKKTAVLKNSVEEPFLENACCNERQDKTYEYFFHHDPHISATNVKVKILSNFLYNLTKMSKSPFYLSLTDTKPVYPAIPSNFSEITIYKAFMFLCNYKNNRPIPSNLLPICINKPNDLNKDLPLKEQITYLKREGFNFTETSLQQLLNMVNKQNILHLSVTPTEINIIQKLRDMVNYLKEHPDDWIAEPFITNFEDLLDTFNISTIEEISEARTLKNYLARENKSLLNNIQDFIKQHSKLGKKSLGDFTEKLKSVFDFENTGDELYYLKETETTYKGANFLRNAIDTIINVFPNIIQNGVDYQNLTLPPHWGLSQVHIGDVIKIIKKYYAPLSQFYNDPQIITLCNTFQNKSVNIKILSQTTPFLANTYKNNTVLHTILDERMINLLYVYYFYSLIYRLTTLSEDSDIIQETGEHKDEVADEDEDVDEIDDADEDLNDISELEIVKGEKKNLSQKIAGLILVLINLIFDNKKTINYNKEAIMERVHRAKEKEKEQITDFLQDLSDEQRNIETVFKKHKLEKWGVGLQKGLTQYVKKTYDQEREALEKQALTDIKLGKNMFVTDMNRDLYALDATMEDRNVQEIDNEINDLSFIPDDDDINEDQDNDGYLHIA